MLYYVKPHKEYVCSVSVDSEFDFDSQWTLMGETCTHYYMHTDNIDKAYAVAKALGVSITTVNTAWEIDPCLLEYDGYYLDTLSWTVEYWDNLPLEMIDAIIATGDEYGFGLYTKAYAYMRNGITVYNNPDIDWDAPAPELTDEVLLPDECEAVDNTEPTIGLCKVSANEFGYVAELWNGDVWDNLSDSDFCEFDELINIIRCNAHFITKLDTSCLNDDDATVLIEHYFDSLPVLIHDVKLDELSVEVITPQEVVEEPQEDLSLSTTTEDKTMSIILPDFSTNGNTFTLVPVEFTSIWYEVPTVDVVELTGQYSELTCDVLNGQFTELAYPLMSPLTCDVMNGQSSHLTSHISDGWYGQCCDLAERPLSTEEREAVQHKVEQFANGKKAHVKQFKSELRPTQEIETLARIQQLSSTVEPEVAPDKPVTVSDKQFAELTRLWEQLCPNTYVSTPLVDWHDKTYSRPIASATGRDYQYSTQVKEFKSTLFHLDEFDVVKQAAQALLDMFSPDEYNKLRDKYGVDVMKKAFNTLQGDVRTRIRSIINEANTIRNGIELTVVATQAPATPKAPKPSTATFASNFNSLVIAKYRELNNGIIKDSLVLNKLTSALRNNNLEAYNSLVTTFNNATAVGLHRKAYDAVVSAS